MSAETNVRTNLVAGLALLTLPDLAGLSEQQVRGVACVWDGIILSPETAVSLGERPAGRRAGGTVSWFPRACRRCVHLAARLQLQQHESCCEQCVDEVSGCAVGFPLLRLSTEYRR